jgi:hypothetical protein
MRTKADPEVTAVLLMIESTTWIAYIDHAPEINAEGPSAHEAFRKIVAQLQQTDCTRNGSGQASVNRIKLVRPALPF